MQASVLLLKGLIALYLFPSPDKFTIVEELIEVEIKFLTIQPHY